MRHVIVNQAWRIYLNAGSLAFANWISLLAFSSIECVLNSLRSLCASCVSTSILKSIKSAPNILHIECAYTREPAFVCRKLETVLGIVPNRWTKNCVQPILAFKVVVIGIAQKRIRKGNDNVRLSLFSIKYIRQLLKISLHQMQQQQQLPAHVPFSLAHTHARLAARSSRQAIYTMELRHSTATCRQRAVDAPNEDDDRSCINVFMVQRERK